MVAITAIRSRPGLQLFFWIQLLEPKKKLLKKVPSSHPSGALFEDVFINLKGGGLKHWCNDSFTLLKTIALEFDNKNHAEPNFQKPSCANFQYQFGWGSLTITMLPFLFKFQTGSMWGSRTPHGLPDVYPIGIPAWCVVPHLVASGSSAVGV